MNVNVVKQVLSLKDLLTIKLKARSRVQLSARFEFFASKSPAPHQCNTSGVHCVSISAGTITATGDKVH
jgi:hypothetical protein